MLEAFVISRLSCPFLHVDYCFPRIPIHKGFLPHIVWLWNETFVNGYVKTAWCWTWLNNLIIEEN